MNISKKMVVPALILVALGLLIAVSPWTVAPVCEVHTADHPNGLWVITAANKSLPMPCGYTARAEIGVGAGIAAVGGIMLFVGSAATIAAMGAVSVALGGMAIALPNLLTKTCALSTHTCNTLTLPTLDLLGIGLIGAAVGIVAYRNKLARP